MRVARVGVVVAAIILGSIAGQAQSYRATLSHVEGVVYLDDTAVSAMASPIVLGDAASIRTGKGRAIVALRRGGILAIDANTHVRVLLNGHYNSNRVEVLAGSALVFSKTSSPHVKCLSDVSLSSDGMFRFDFQYESFGPTCQFRVFDGAAAVPLVSTTLALRSGQTMKLDPTCGDMVGWTSFDVQQSDEFDRWSRQQAAVKR